jgi:hypothetical protein
MPFEAYPIQGPTTTNRGSDRATEWTADRVAAAVASTYQEVSDKGGEIVGSHTVDAVDNGRYDRQGGVSRRVEVPAVVGSFLILVAEYPDSKTKGKAK